MLPVRRLDRRRICVCEHSNLITYQDVHTVLVAPCQAASLPRHAGRDRGYVANLAYTFDKSSLKLSDGSKRPQKIPEICGKSKISQAMVNNPAISFVSACDPRIISLNRMEGTTQFLFSSTHTRIFTARHRSICLMR